MTHQPTLHQPYDVLIIGGSYAGLSAAMALGRARRKVLIIDSSQPCNRQTPQSHNFLTRDGSAPAEIARIGREQVLAYPTVTFVTDQAIGINLHEGIYQVHTASGQIYPARKLIFATGIKDLMPDIPGMADCWGISVIHCPYCHGYEYSDQPTAILANGDTAFELAKMIRHWTPDLHLLTNGPATLNPEQRHYLTKRNISLNESAVQRIVHQTGYIQSLELSDQSSLQVNALYARLPFIQHCSLPEALGCTLNKEGLLEVNMMQETNIQGIYACGDNSSRMRSVAQAVYSGNMAGAALNKALIDADY